MSLETPPDPNAPAPSDPPDDAGGGHTPIPLTDDPPPLDAPAPSDPPDDAGGGHT